MHRRRRRRRPQTPVAAGAPTATDVEATSSALELDDVARVKFLLLHEPAPPSGEHVALATRPMRVPELPQLVARFVDEADHEATLRRLAVEGEVLLGVLLRDHQSVKLSDVTRSEELLEHPHSLARVVISLVTHCQARVHECHGAKKRLPPIYSAEQKLHLNLKKKKKKKRQFKD